MRRGVFVSKEEGQELDDGRAERFLDAYADYGMAILRIIRWKREEEAKGRYVWYNGKHLIRFSFRARVTGHKQDAYEPLSIVDLSLFLSGEGFGSCSTRVWYS